MITVRASHNRRKQVYIYMVEDSAVDMCWYSAITHECNKVRLAAWSSTGTLYVQQVQGTTSRQGRRPRQQGACPTPKGSGQSRQASNQQQTLVEQVDGRARPRRDRGTRRITTRIQNRSPRGCGTLGPVLQNRESSPKPLRRQIQSESLWRGAGALSQLPALSPVEWDTVRDACISTG